MVDRGWIVNHRGRMTNRQGLAFSECEMKYNCKARNYYVALPRTLYLTTSRWGGTSASFRIVLSDGISLPVTLNRIDKRPYKKHLFTIATDSVPDLRCDTIAVDWDADASPAAIKSGDEILGYVDGTVFDPSRVSLGYVRKMDLLGNRWEIRSEHGSLYMRREKRHGRFSWMNKQYNYGFNVDGMKSATIDIRLIVGLVVEFWTPRLLMYADPGPTG